MNPEQNLVTEEWDDIIEQKVPGRKTMLMMVFTMLVALAAAVGFIAFKEASNQRYAVIGAMVFGAESSLFFIISKYLPPAPIKIPLLYIAKFFGFAMCFTLIGSLFK